jgi:hypothetical protein
VTPSFSPAYFKKKLTHFTNCNKDINEVYSETIAKDLAAIKSVKEQTYITP